MSAHSLDHARYYGVEEGSSTPLLSTSSSQGLDVDNESTDNESFTTKVMTKRKKTFICLGVCTLSTLAVLLITFLAIIPAIMQDVTDDEEISMSTATISNPTDEAFDVRSTITFSDKPLLPATAKMHDTYLTWEGVQLAVMKHNNKLDVDTPPQELRSSVEVSDLAAFTSFNEYLMDASSFNWHIHAHADAVAVGDKVDIVVDKDIKMEGFAGFPVDPVIKTVSVYEGTPDTLYSLSTTLLFSASNIALEFGQDLFFDFMSNGVKVGTGTIPNSKFLTGEFTADATIAMSMGTPEESAEVNNVCGRFISQMETSVTMENFYLAKPIAWLTPALAGIKLSSVLPPVTEGVMDSLDMYVYVGDILNVQWGGHFYNPLDSVLTLYSMKCDISFEGEVIAQVDEPDIEIVIPPKTHIVSAADMYARTVVAHTKQVLDLLKEGGGLLELDCMIDNTIGEFMVSLNYIQHDVPSTMHEGHPPEALESL
mmetsp:Transcript_2576/g.4688  ORF Transcript_2576/g.4688 Transcript_2576/m.4688 type:complete len:482 (+) Transcript_2576:23-1468(+)